MPLNSSVVKLRQLERVFPICKMDQYSRCNNVVVDGIPSSVKKMELEDKCTEVLGKTDIKIHETDTEA